MEQRYQEVISLFEAAFNEKKVARTLFSKGFDLFSRTVEGGNAALEAYLSDNIVLEYYPSEEPIFKASLLWQNVELPIKAGQAVGFIEVISSDGKRLTSAPLYSAKNVEATFKHRFSVGYKKVKKAISEHAAWVMAFCGLLLVVSAFYCTRRTLKSQKGK
jgi:D-alanyl-D-alanine carboxypeptidase